jgi:uncharacterized protein YidB (DUF937 family)
MGMLDGLLGQILGGAMSQGARDPSRQQGMGGAAHGAGAGALMALLPVLLQVLQRNGGLGGMLSQFQQQGYGKEADSWVSTGSNMPIDGNILSQVLGSGQMDQIAEQLGMSRREAADQMASALPDVVDHLTPHGNVPADSDDLVNRAMEILQRGGR